MARIGPPKLMASVGASLVFLAVATAVELIFLAAQDWLGSGDIVGFSCLTVPLGVVVGITIALFLQFTWQWHPVLKYSVGIFLGVLLGFAPSICITVTLNGWPWGFSFPALYCWLLGSVAGVQFAIAYRHPRTWFVAVSLFVIVGALAFVQYRHLPPFPTIARQPQFVVYFKKSATNDEINYFWDNVIGVPTGKGDEHNLSEGICSEVAGYDPEGHHTVIIDFWSDTTQAQRENVRHAIESSPDVEKLTEIPPAGSGPIYRCGGPSSS